MSRARERQEEYERQRRELHERLCREGDGWSHSFGVCCKPKCKCEEINGNFVAYRHYGRQRPSDISPTNIRHIQSNQSDFEYYTIENWQKVGAALGQSNMLTALILSSCSLAKEGTDAFISGCKNCTWPSLKYLDLSGNKGYAVLKAFHPMLKSLSTLDSLSLNNTNFGINLQNYLQMCSIIPRSTISM